MAFRLAILLAVAMPAAVWAGGLPAGPPPAAFGSLFSTSPETAGGYPQHWREDLRAPGTRRWFEDQDHYARAALGALPGRAALRDRIDALEAQEVYVDNAQFGGNRVFYLKREPGADHVALYVRDGPEGAERRVVDPASPQTAITPGRIAFYRAAPNGRRLAYGIAPQGSATASLHVIDVDSGRELGPSLLVMSTGNPVQWRIDGGALFYAQRIDVPAKGDPPAGFVSPALWMREFDMDGNSADHRLLDHAVDADPDIAAGARVRMHVGASSWAVVSTMAGGARAVALFVAPLAGLHEARPHWRKLLDADAGVTAVALRGEWIYLLTNAGAPNGRIVRWSLVDARPFTLADAEVVMETSEREITGISAARDALYVGEREAGHGRLMRLEYNVKLARPGRRTRNKTPAALPKVAGVARSTDVILPVTGSVDEVVTDPLHNGALVRLSGWTQAPGWFVIDGKGAVTPSTLSPPSSVDFRDIVATHLVAKAGDGGEIPICVLERRDVARDGRAPTLLHAYSGSVTPDFVPARLAWLERGGVLVFVEGRSSAARGDPSQGADALARKTDSGHDLIDVADFLVANHWTSTAVLGIEGSGNGSEAVGHAMVERPDLVRAVISDSGAPDRLRPDVDYPSTLLIARYDELSVDLWRAGKTTAALQAASGSPTGGIGPALLRVDFTDEHDSATAHSSATDLEADVYAFALWRLGDPDFQPQAH